MPKPSDWEHHKVEKPKDDNGYFEVMCRVIMMTGLNYRILHSKWPGIKKAFDDFNLDKVSSYNEIKVEELMMNKDVIRNLAKIRAVIANAKKIIELQAQYGSFEKYIDSLNHQGEDTIRSEIDRQFSFLGKGTTVLFLYSIGISLPKAYAEWEEKHKG